MVTCVSGVWVGGPWKHLYQSEPQQETDGTLHRAQERFIKGLFTQVWAGSGETTGDSAEPRGWQRGPWPRSA